MHVWDSLWFTSNWMTDNSIMHGIVSLKDNTCQWNLYSTVITTPSTVTSNYLYTRQEKKTRTRHNIMKYHIRFKIKVTRYNTLICYRGYFKCSSGSFYFPLMDMFSTIVYVKWKWSQISILNLEYILVALMKTSKYSSYSLWLLFLFGTRMALFRL